MLAVGQWNYRSSDCPVDQHLLQQHILTCCSLVLYEPWRSPNSTSISTKLVKKNSIGSSSKTGKDQWLSRVPECSRGNWKDQLQPQRNRIMKRAFKWGNESLQISLLKHSPKNLTGMRKTLAKACSNYVQNHKYEKYSLLAFPRQIVNKHSFLTWGSVFAVGRLSVGCLTYFSVCTTKIFLLCLHTGS